MESDGTQEDLEWGHRLNFFQQSLFLQYPSQLGTAKPLSESQKGSLVLPSSTSVLSNLSTPLTSKLSYQNSYPSPSESLRSARSFHQNQGHLSPRPPTISPENPEKQNQQRSRGRELKKVMFHSSREFINSDGFARDSGGNCSYENIDSRACSPRTPIDGTIDSSRKSSEWSAPSMSSCDTLSSVSSHEFSSEMSATFHGPGPALDGELSSLLPTCEDSSKFVTYSGFWDSLLVENNALIVSQSNHFSPPLPKTREIAAAGHDIEPNERIVNRVVRHLTKSAEISVEEHSGLPCNSQTQSLGNFSLDLASFNNGQRIVSKGELLPNCNKKRAALETEAGRERGHFIEPHRIWEKDEFQELRKDNINIRAVGKWSGTNQEDPEGYSESVETEGVDSANCSHCGVSIHPRSTLSPSVRSFSTVNSITFGKASPYSSISQDSETDSNSEMEIELSDDDYASDSSQKFSLSHSESMITRRKVLLDILSAFWDIYNRDFGSYVLNCLVILATEAGIETQSDMNSSSRSVSSATTVLVSPDSTNSSAKRKFSESDDLDEGSGQGPSPPNRRARVTMKEEPTFQYACFFRKHNPRKYNIHCHQRCALGAFPSIARIKEHLYRRHKTPIQCVRCWLFFKDQDMLNIHLTANNICQLRNGEIAEGITLDMEKRLRSRKKPPGDQTEEERWRDIYQMLFPGEEVPSPFYEAVQDDAAQSSETLDMSIEEFMRQEVPQIFTARLEAEVNNLSLEKTGLFDDPVCLRESFINRMRTLINEAQDAAVQAYRQRSSETASQFNQFMTPGPSSCSVSFPNKVQETCHIPLQPDQYPIIELNEAVLSWPQGFQSINDIVSGLDADAMQARSMNQVGQATNHILWDVNNDLSSPDITIRYDMVGNDRTCTPNLTRKNEKGPSPATQDIERQNLLNLESAQPQWESAYDLTTWTLESESTNLYEL